MHELKFEATTWELYEAEIREFVLDEGTVEDWQRRGINTRLKELYEDLEPYLEAVRTLALSRGYKRAAFEKSKNTNDPYEKSDLRALLEMLDGHVQGLVENVARLREEYQPKLDELVMVRAIRASVSKDDSDGDPEPP